MIKYKKIIFIFFCLFFIFYSGFPQLEEGKTIELKNEAKIQSIIYLSIGYPMSTNSYSFFDNYLKIIQGLKSNFETSLILYLSNKYFLNDNYRLGLSCEYFTANLNDPFIQKITTTDEEFYRTLTEEINITSLPCFFSFEYSPTNLQFSTYIGIGLGIDITKIKWLEKLETTNIIDKRKGGLHYDNIILSPVCRLFSGIELGFDKYTDNMVIKSLNFEFNITYSMRKANIFKNISDQFDEPIPENINRNFTIIPFYFGLNIGVSFNLYG